MVEPKAQSFVALVSSLEEVVRLASAGSLGSIGRGPRTIWATHSPDALTRPTLKALHEVPAAREGVLDFVGLLVHEGVHMHLVERDAVGGAKKGRADASGLDEAVEVLVDALRTKLLERPELWRRLLLQWATELLGAVSSRNAGRRSTGGGPQAQLQLFISIPQSRAVAELMKACLSSLLAESPEDCIAALLGSANFGPHFDWVLAFVGSCFPPSIVRHILAVGRADWEAAASADAGASGRPMAEAYEAKLRSLGSILWHVAVLRRPELTAQLRELVEAGLRDNATAKEQLGLLFVFKLGASRLDMLQIILRTTKDLLTEATVVRTMRLWSRVPWRNLHSDKDTLIAMERMMTSLDQEMLAIVMEPLLALAFPDAAAAAAADANTAQIRRFASTALEEMCSNLVQLVQYQGAFALSGESAVLDHLDGRLRDLLPLLFSEDPLKRRLVFRLLCSTALARGEERCLELAALLLFTATEPSVEVVISALGYVGPFFPSLVPQLLSRLPSLAASFAAESAGARWLDIVHRLATRERQASEDDPVHDLRLCFHLSAEFGRWVPLFVDFACDSGVEDEEQIRRLASVLSLLELVGLPSPQLPRRLTKALHAFLKLYYIILARADAEVPATLDSVETLGRYLVHFLGAQEDFARRHFLRRFVQIADEETERLFGEKPSSVAEVGSPVASLLGSLDAGAGKTRLTKLVHTGQIGKGARGSREKAPPSAPALLRRWLWLELLGNLSRASASSAAAALVEAATADAVAASSSWEGWDEERGGLQRILSTAKRLEERPWIWEALWAMAPAYPSLWHALPIMRAGLGVVIVQLESSPDKARPVSAAHLAALDAWVALAVRGSLIPPSLGGTAELLPHLSQFEAIALLLEIWRYLQDVCPDAGRLAALAAQWSGGSGAPLGLDPEPYRGLCRLLIQAHIGEAGHLYPTLFPCPKETAAV